jgi:hypothetical protein
MKTKKRDHKAREKEREREREDLERRRREKEAGEKRGKGQRKRSNPFVIFAPKDTIKKKERCSVALFTNAADIYFSVRMHNRMEGCFYEFVIYYRFRGGFT